MLVALHGGTVPAVVSLPEPRFGWVWRLLSDSAAAAMFAGTLRVATRSVVLLREVPAPRRPRLDAGAALGRLAAAAGIAAGWWDIEGRHHATGEDTSRALLAAMHLPAGTRAEAADSLARLSEEANRPIPPALVVRAGESGVLRLGSTLRDRALRLAIEGDDGSRTDFDVAAGPRGRGAHRRPRRADPANPAHRPAGAASGALRLRVAGTEAACRLTVAPPRCHLPARLLAGGRAWGIAAQLYTLRRARGDQGIGDLTDLAELVRIARGMGAGAIGLNPLHALFPQDRGRASPYHPSDRRFLDPLIIDVMAPPLAQDAPAVRAALTQAAPAFAALAAKPMVDYPAVWKAKRRVLEAAFTAFEPGPDFHDFVAGGGEALLGFARFQAIAETQPSADWRSWPADLRDPVAPAVTAAAPPERVRFALFLQWLADRQLAAAVGGMEIGLYRDLAVGAAPDGAEAWAAGTSLIHGVSVGAPPDPLGPDGQIWGLPPPDPRALRAAGYAPIAALLAANMRHAGALRIDHVMGLARLFLVPDGARGQDGTYLAYPIDDMLGQVALESVRAGCLVVGEDLGTVPDGIRATLAERAVLSYQVLRFARDGKRPRPPAAWPRDAVACAATHDIATVAGWWQGTDIGERATLGLLDGAAAEAERAAREAEKAELLALLAAEGISPEDDLPAAVLALLARTPCRLVLAQADDLAGETMAVNLPGTDRERPNWRRRLHVDAATLCAALPAALRAIK